MRDAVRHGAVTAVLLMVGGAHIGLRMLRQNRPRTEKSCGPDARGSGVKPCGDAAARPGARIDQPRGDGGNSATLPEESTKDTVKTIRAGKAGRSASPVIHPVCIFCCARIAGAAGALLSLRPLAIIGRQATASLGRNTPRERESVSAIAKADEVRSGCHMLRHCERSDLSAEAFGEGGSNPGIPPGRQSGLLRRISAKLLRNFVASSSQ